MKGILFKPEMTRAIIEGRKTQTRRLIKTPNGWSGFNVHSDGNGCRYEVYATDEHGSEENVKGQTREIKPLYLPEDLVFIKETIFKGKNDRWYYDEGNAEVLGEYKDPILLNKPIGRTISSLLMPAGAARYFLYIESVRIERLRDISEEDAIAEGVDLNRGLTAREAYQTLWDRINTGCEKQWHNNPFVWVYTFTPSIEPL